MPDNHKCIQIEKISRIDAQLQDTRNLQTLLLKILITTLASSVFTLLTTIVILLN